MTEVISVKFKNRGKSYYFAPNGKEVKTGMQVIVETSKGLEIAECSQGNHEVEDTAVVQPLRPVIRIATQDDMRVAEINKQREKEAFVICQQKIAEHGLDMKLVDVECNFEGNKTLFFFTSDGRVDFRELVKDLAGIFRNRIELRQIGVRDEAKMIGGLGICGRPFCCSKFLDEFQPVSTKMAKVQSMSLNPSKISGSCGRLMCCLRYEEEAYEELVKSVPKQGAFVETPAGYGNVTQVNLLRQLVKVKLDGEGDDTVRTYRAVEVATVPGGRPKDGEALPSVLKYIPEPEEIEEPEDEWAMPEPIINDETEEIPEAKPEQVKKPNGNNHHRRHHSKGGNKPKSNNKPAEKQVAKPAEKPKDSNKAVVKPKPKQNNQNNQQQAKPKQDKPAGEKQQVQKKTNNNRHRYYHRGKPKNGSGGAPKQ